MILHTVEPGQTIDTIAAMYGISADRLTFDNQIYNPTRLVVGQTLLILIPEVVHQVRVNESVYSIASDYGITPLTLVRNNPYLLFQEYISPGQTIVIQYQDEKLGNMTTNGYAFPTIKEETLNETLLFLTELSVFSYGFTTNGELISPLTNDVWMIEKAKEYGVSPILVLTPFTENAVFNNQLISTLINNTTVQQNLIQNLLTTMRQKGYQGVDIDFEFVLPQDKEGYVAFIRQLTETMNNNGFKVSVALAPKTSATQKGLIYEGIDYQVIGAYANSVLVMTYEWGYTYGPPMAVAPLNKVREVLNFAVSQIPPEKIDMGIPNYGYDWTLPFVKGNSKATLIGNVEAIQIASENNAIIQFDTTAMSPFFEYSKNGQEHIVWFEDARSIDAKLRLVAEYGFRGVGYWNLMRYFRQNWLLLNALYDISPSSLQ